MPTAIAKNKPTTKRPQVSQNRKPTKAQVDAQLKKHLDFVKRQAGHNHRKWIRSHPSANLGDLLQYLEQVQDELLAFDYDDVLAEIIDELGDAADWLSEWGSIEVHIDGLDEPATVGYRLDNVEEDIREVEELIEGLGESYKVKRLPNWTPRSKAS
jgi:hypothetical protein